MKKEDYVMINASEILELLDKIKYEHGDKKVIELYEKRILELKDPRLSFEFAKRYKGANIRAHEDVVLDSDGTEYESYLYQYNFAHEIREANVKRLSEKIIKSGNPYYNFLFARDIAGVDKKAHEKVVLEAKNANVSLLFALEVKEADKKAQKGT